FNNTATTDIYTLCLHDALPISTSLKSPAHFGENRRVAQFNRCRTPCQQSEAKEEPRLPITCALRRRLADLQRLPQMLKANPNSRSEEHTSELQSRENLVCRLLL